MTYPQIYVTLISSFKKKLIMCCQNTLHEITTQVAQKAQEILGNRLREVILYGSYARGDFNDDSDIDIMILADVGEHEIWDFEDKISETTSELALKYDELICAHINNKILFEQRLPILPFYQNVRKDGVQIYVA